MGSDDDRRGTQPAEGDHECVGVPVMTKSTFIQSERSTGKWWRKELEQLMLEAGREEKQLAEERGDYHDGVPAITVIVDGGWSKRSHKHRYNAKSGVAIIIGKETRKLLHIGVCNKYCAACTQGIPKEKHACYKNWDASSSQMETDIIVQGFCESERVHGVRSYASLVMVTARCTLHSFKVWVGGGMPSRKSNVQIMPLNATDLALRSLLRRIQHTRERGG